MTMFRQVPYEQQLRSATASMPIKRSKYVAGIAVVFLFWLAAAFLIKLPTNVVSSDARVTSIDRPARIYGGRDGYVSRVYVELGQVVQQGDPLFSFDDTELLIAIERAESLLLQEEQLDQTLADRESLLGNLIGRTQIANQLRQERSRAAQTGIASRRKESEAREDSTRELEAEGRVAYLDFLAVEAEARQWASFAEEEKIREAILDEEVKLDKLTIEQRINETRAERIQSIKRLRDLDAFLKQLQHDLSQTVVSAPFSGRVTFLASTASGQDVLAEQHIVTVSADSQFIVVATFPVAESLGRMAAGNSASIHLSAYPWIRYGALDATVVRVGGTEDSEGFVAELEIVSSDEAVPPLVGGMAARAIVEVDSKTLVQRMMGTH